MSWKEEQRLARESTKPRRINPILYDRHDHLFMSKSTVFNREYRRRKVVDRRMTRKGFEYGLRIGSRDYNLVHAIAKRQAE